MNESRINQLLEYLKDTPNDPFLKYALALEYEKSKELEAMELYDDLLTNNSDYLPTYFQAAHLAIELEENEKAKRIFEEGIRLAEEKGEQKTKAELQNAYQNFLFEID